MESSNSHLLWGWELGEVMNFIIGVTSYLRILNTLEQRLSREWEKRRNEFKQNFNKQQQHGFCFDWEEGIQRTNGSNVLIKCSLVFLMEKMYSNWINTPSFASVKYANNTLCIYWSTIFQIHIYYLFDLHKNSVTRAKQGLLFPFKQEKTAGQTRWMCFHGRG